MVPTPELRPVSRVVSTAPTPAEEVQPTPQPAAPVVRTEGGIYSVYRRRKKHNSNKNLLIHIYIHVCGFVMTSSSFQEKGRVLGTVTYMRGEGEGEGKGRTRRMRL